MKKMIPLLMLLSGVCIAHAQDAADNIEVAKKIFEAFNSHDWEKMLRYYDRHAIFEDPSFPKPINDPAFITSHHQELTEHFPDIHDDIKSIYPSGDHVIIEFVSKGNSIKLEKLSLPICTILTFKNRKVIRDATYYDNR
jgi:ketosteroid isomerase-like protein